MNHDPFVPSDGISNGGTPRAEKADDYYLTVPIAVLVGFIIGFAFIDIAHWLGLDRGPVAAAALATIVVFILANQRKQ